MGLRLPRLRTSPAISGPELIHTNLHVHSTVSDGDVTPEELAERAALHHLYIAITDHNTVDAHREMTSPHVLPGVEVTAGEAGVDVLLYGEREHLLAFFDDRIAPQLNSENPLYHPAAIEPLDLIGDATDAGLDVVVPHF